MAVKNPTLDPVIIQAARAEFLEFGFQKASLHKIAQRAGITTGALYTRYKSKDDLFCSLVYPTLQQLGPQIGPIQALYEKAHTLRTPEALLAAIRAEEKLYLDLLFENYDTCVLFFCKSAGSSLEQSMNRMMAEKARQTVEFFRSMARQDLDFAGVELIMSQQFAYYRQILLKGYTREKAVSCMETVDLFLEAGWKAILDRIL